MDKKYIIIPSCSDLNRGDQALVWETKRFAEECGFVGEYYMMSEQGESVLQSQQKGFKIITPIIEHPSRLFKSKENISYTKMLKMKWGIVSIFDFLKSIFILFCPIRKLTKLMIGKEKRIVYELMENANAIFMKGGGLLQTYGGISATYSMYFWVYPILLAYKLNKPIYIMPNSFGPFKGPFVKKIARYSLKKCKIVSSRETISQKMVKKELGLSISNYPDLAFYLSTSGFNKREILEKYNLPINRKLVALTMRPYRFPKSINPEEKYKILQLEMGKFIKWLYKKGYMPVIVEHTLAINSHENDKACIRAVVSNIDDKQYRIISSKSYDCCDLKCIYGCCDYIVGMRFHSIIFAFGNNVPGIAIAYAGNKTQGIMHDIGLEDYVVNVENLTVDILKSKFLTLIENEEKVISKIKKYACHTEQMRKKFIEECKKASNLGTKK